MTQQLNIHETKTQLSKLIELTQAGEEFVIAKAGKPVAKLVPLDKARPPWKPRTYFRAPPTFSRSTSTNVSVC
jgi:prevent-host-death family protein